VELLFWKLCFPPHGDGERMGGLTGVSAMTMFQDVEQIVTITSLPVLYSIFTQKFVDCKLLLSLSQSHYLQTVQTPPNQGILHT
jgi:hypothetical protein